MNIREKIESILKDLIPGIDISSDDLMSQEGVESLTMISIISELDLAFDIEITFDDIENNRLHSVDSIEQMVIGYLK